MYLANRVDARHLGFAFLGTEHPVLLAVHAPELFATHFSYLDPWKQIGLVLGQCFLRAPPVVLSELCFPLQLLETLPDPGELWGGGWAVLSTPGHCVLSTEPWGIPLSSGALYQACAHPPGTTAWKPHP